MGRRATCIGLICAAPLSAAAATLPIIGSYGNEAGCALARTDEYNPVEGVHLLTSSELSTAVMLCSFDSVTPAPNDRLRVAMTCAHEGSGPEDSTKGEAEISGSPSVGYTVHFSDGTSWGRCKNVR